MSLVFNVLLALLNTFGLDIVGKSQYIFAILVLTPVIIFTGMCFPFYNQQSISPQNAPPTLDFSLLFSNLVWQCTGFDQATNLAGEVSKPQKTLPISLLVVVLLVVVSFVMPILSGVMMEPNYLVWENGAFSEISLKLPGCKNGWLQIWLILAGALSSLSVLNAYITCTSRELYCNAYNGILPLTKSWLGRLKRFQCKKKKQDEMLIQQADSVTDGTDILKNEYEGNSVPFYAILVVSFVPVAFQFLTFEQLLTMGSFLIATVMSIQMGLYFYNRHGKYGYYSMNQMND